MNPRLTSLQDYPFQRLNALKQGLTPAQDRAHVALSIGEPQHAPPAAVVAHLADTERLTRDLAVYPATRGRDGLREAASAWLKRRFNASVDPDVEVLPVAGTREALFSFGQAVVGTKANPIVMMPNPFYQIYEGAALLSGAEPYYVNADLTNGYAPDFSSVPDDVWQRVELLYLCSPGNPTGHVLSPTTHRWLIEQAHRFDFVIAADECYSEIYLDETAPPTGLLEQSTALGNTNHQRCVVFHSLSKRSSLPGLRSGFVAGDASVLASYFQYRTYEGCALAEHVQTASELAWQDEAYVRTNRALYREKFRAVLPILESDFTFAEPTGGFYVWLRTPAGDVEFAAALFQDLNITVLPGSFLGRDAHGRNPGSGHVRIALVASLDECVDAAERIRTWQAHR